MKSRPLKPGHVQSFPKSVGEGEQARPEGFGTGFGFGGDGKDLVDLVIAL